MRLGGTIFSSPALISILSIWLPRHHDDPRRHDLHYHSHTNRPVKEQQSNNKQEPKYSNSPSTGQRLRARRPSPVSQACRHRSSQPRQPRRQGFSSARPLRETQSGTTSSDQSREQWTQFKIRAPPWRQCNALPDLTKVCGLLVILSVCLLLPLASYHRFANVNTIASPSPSPSPSPAFSPACQALQTPSFAAAAKRAKELIAAAGVAVASLHELCLMLGTSQSLNRCTHPLKKFQRYRPRKCNHTLH